MQFSRIFAAVVFHGAAIGSALPAPQAEVGHLEDRQIIVGLNCLLGGLVGLVQNILGDPAATPYCQSVLGYATVTRYTTSVGVVTTTATSFVPTGTNTILSTVTAAPVQETVTAPAATITATEAAATITSCTAGGRKERRQIGVSVGVSVGATATQPVGLSGAASASITQACQCLNVPTPTTSATITQLATTTVFVTQGVAVSSGALVQVTPTETTTVTPTSIVTTTPTQYVCDTSTADTSCNNAGIQWAYYDDSSPSDEWAANNPEYLQTVSPITNGAENDASQVASWTGNCGSSADNLVTPSGQSLSCNHFIFQARGYLYVQTAGEYTFSSVSGVDDLEFLWAGNAETVNSDYTAANANGIATSSIPFSFTINSAAGQYIPFRVAYVQVTGPWGFGFTVTGPDGSVVFSDAEAGNVVQYPCGSIAPDWRPWGHE